MTALKTFYVLSRTRGWLPVIAASASAAIKSSRDCGIQVRGISKFNPETRRSYAR
jgi:hypothetical protein